MTKKPEDSAAIVQAAAEIERNLVRLEELSRSVRNARLNTEKNIERAGRTLQQALQQQEQLAGSLQRLGQAMVQMQQRQQAAIEGIGVRAVEIQDQANRLADHLQRFGALGMKAAEATHLLQDLPGTGEQDAQKSVVLLDLEQLLAGLSDDARALAASADEADLTEIAREASSLRQRIDAARGRLAQLSKAGRPNVN